jgi:hypothetical protein
MKGFFKRIAKFSWQVSLVLAAVILVTVLWFTDLQYKTTSIAREFYGIVEDSKQTDFDLRDFNPVDWDELVYREPYTDICDYGIKGYDKGGANCEGETKGSESFILFLNNNELVGTVPVNRRKINFGKTLSKTRITQDKAIFEFRQEGDFPLVEVSSE